MSCAFMNLNCIAFILSSFIPMEIVRRTMAKLDNQLYLTLLHTGGHRVIGKKLGFSHLQSSVTIAPWLFHVVICGFGN